MPTDILHQLNHIMYSKKTKSPPHQPKLTQKEKQI